MLAELAFVTSEVVTVVGDTFAVFTGFVCVTGDVFAGVDTLSINTGELTWAGDSDTGIGLALTKLTGSAFGTGHTLTRISFALTLVTNLFCLASHTCTGVLGALAVFARFACATGDIFAGGEAFAIFAVLAAGTLEVVTGVGGADTLFTDLT